ncbi:DNA-binding protein [Candidatus Brocadia pituitae]|nr:DNA-binding protein [Candidatus Brocadia pituitae]
MGIAKKGNLIVTDEQSDFLDEVTIFNIKARYPDYKNRFYKRATGEFAREYIIKIKEFQLWLLKKINT